MPPLGISGQIQRKQCLYHFVGAGKVLHTLMGVLLTVGTGLYSPIVWYWDDRIITGWEQRLCHLWRWIWLWITMTESDVCWVSLLYPFWILKPVWEGKAHQLVFDKFFWFVTFYIHHLPISLHNWWCWCCHLTETTKKFPMVIHNSSMHLMVYPY